jgi:predicted Zn-dependent protease
MDEKRFAVKSLRPWGPFFSWLLKASVIFVTLTGCSVPSHTILNPYTSRIQVLPQDEAWEEKLGEESYTRIALSHGIPHDSPEEVAVHRVANELLTAATDTEFANQVNRYEWQIRVIMDESESLIMDLPSGKLLMTTSALAATQNNIDLAAILGHGIGHVLLRHGGERMSQKVHPLPLFMQISKPKFRLRFSLFTWPKRIMQG